MVWMCAERKRVWGELAAWHLAGVVARMPLTAVDLDPKEINPYRAPEPEREDVRKAREFIAKRMWAALARNKCGGG